MFSSCPLLSSCTPGRSSTFRDGLTYDIQLAEKITYFDCCRLRRVGAVDDVLLHVVGQVGADRPAVGLLRVGGPHQLTVARDDVLPFQHHRDDRARRHEPGERCEEGTLPVDGVEPFRLLFREVEHPHRHDADPRGFEPADHLADDPLSDPVGLHDRQGPLLRIDRGSHPFIRALASSYPAISAFLFSSSVPFGTRERTAFSTASRLTCPVMAAMAPRATMFATNAFPISSDAVRMIGSRITLNVPLGVSFTKSSSTRRVPFGLMSL